MTVFLHRSFARRALLLATATCGLASPALAKESATSSSSSSYEPTLVDTIVVSAKRAQSDQTMQTVEPPAVIALPADATGIAARAPGGALVGNGALSGQLSYRGLSGERVLGRVNGQRFATGGPNAMDPPLHYAPSVLLDRIELARGTSPVSDGPGLAGSVNAILVETEFGAAGALAPQAAFRTQYRSVDDSYAVGGLAGLANDRWRLGVLASREQGEDYDFAGGTATGTSFERNLYGVNAGFRSGPGELFAEYRRSETDPSGNPPFALDIVYFDTDFLQSGFRGEIAKDIGLELRLGHVAVRHLMDNQTLRQPPAPTPRATFADADTSTADLRLRFSGETRHVSIGADAELADKQVRITNPANAAFFIDAQPQLGSQRIGAFAEWRGGLGAAEFELGARIDRTRQDAGIPQLGAAVPMGPRMLANAFIASGRTQSDTTVDAVLRGWVPLGDVTPRLTLARKTRVPSLLERFAWLPTEASFGLADGNIYVGNQALKPETAWIAELGLDWQSDAVMLRPTIFYRRVDDYIQGTPFDATPGTVNSTVEMVAAMNGDTTPLMFRNVDAQLYGADVDFRITPVARIELSGTASYVRGERRDSADNLYRVAPANLRLAAAYQGDRLAFGAELNAAARQKDVSLTNGEVTSSSYAVVGLFGQYRLTEGLRVEAGVENIFDTFYQPHLSGRSRVGASDVPVGDRLPGAGRGVWLRVAAGF